MKLKKLVALLTAAAMTVGTLVGCGTTTTPQGGSEETTAAAETKGEEPAAADNGETLTFEIYDQAANYQGVLNGWFAQAVKEKFNVEISLIAPQVAGDAIFQTRAATGNLGDIVILEKGVFQECVENGLVKDIAGDIYNYENLKTYEEQINMFNSGLNVGESIYGIPCQMTNTSPTAYSSDEVYSSPLLRWDLYEGVGAPEIADLDGLLDVLAAMMEKYPTNEAGDPCYAMSLWPDWDGGDGMLGIANVVQLTTWYGEKIKGSAILKPDDTFIPLTDKEGSYYKMLNFLYKAQQRGLVDPDSSIEKWDDACAKMSAGQVYLMWYSWQKGFWNSLDRLEAGTGFIFVPVADQSYYATADSFYGSDRVWGVGSQVDDAKYARIMEFLDWYASPEGLMLEHDGIEGFTYEKGEDGRLYRINDSALMDNLPVPEEWGGAGYADGQNYINQWIVESCSINPITGEPYNSSMWSTYKEQTMTDMKKAWQEKFDASEPADWMQKNGKLVVAANVSVALATDTPDISVIRNQCNETLCDYSWRMIYAADDAEFDAMWDELTEELNGFGFEELYNFDVEKYTVELEAQIAAR